MAARIASGLNIQPEIVLKKRAAPKRACPSPKNISTVVREGMNLVVNGAGTAVRSKLQLENVAMGGKTGTAQVRRIAGSQRGQSGEWKYRDHGLYRLFRAGRSARATARRWSSNMAWAARAQRHRLPRTC